MAVSVNCPSPVVTTIEVVPSAFPIIKPLALTVATAGSDEVHETFLFVALTGEMIGLSCTEPPAKIGVTEGRLTPVTGTLRTVTDAAFVLPPSTAVAVMMALPGTTPVT